MGSPTGWGPSHQTGRHARQPGWFIALAVVGLVVWLAVWRTTTGFVVVVLAPLFAGMVLASIARAAGGAPRPPQASGWRAAMTR